MTQPGDGVVVRGPVLGARAGARAGRADPDVVSSSSRGAARSSRRLAARRSRACRAHRPVKLGQRLGGGGDVLDHDARARAARGPPPAVAIRWSA